MAVYRTTCALHSTSGLPADDCVTTYHWETDEANPTPAIAAKLNGHVAAAWNSVTAPGTTMPAVWLSSEISRVNNPTNKTYAISGGSPLATNNWLSIAANADASAFPSEVALCLSYNADLTDVLEEAPDDADPDTRPERPASRRRGRIYIGPLIQQAGGATAPAKPQSAFIDCLLGMGDFLATPTDAALTAVNARWVIYSNAGLFGTTYQVIRVTVDDAFDTQRRRGRDPVQRYFLMV